MIKKEQTYTLEELREICCMLTRLVMFAHKHVNLKTAKQIKEFTLDALKVYEK